MLSKNWIESSPESLSPDFNKNLVDNWMLVTAGSSEKIGTMTVNWGGSGFIWKKMLFFL